MSDMRRRVRARVLAARGLIEESYGNALNDEGLKEAGRCRRIAARQEQERQRQRSGSDDR